MRLYVDQSLGPEQEVEPGRDAAHYLVSVMRRRTGDAVSVFNGRDGEWRARITVADRRAVRLVCEAQTAPLRPPPDLWLLFAPLKKARTDFVVEKATELGVARLRPVQTEHTNAERVRTSRLRAHAIEAAEQCGGTYVPDVDELLSLRALLANWPAARRLIVCDEALAGGPATPFPDAGGSSAILIGPEGGFSESERAALRAVPDAASVRLGPRILRADTAAIAAITLWQARFGDWR